MLLFNFFWPVYSVCRCFEVAITSCFLYKNKFKSACIHTNKSSFTLKIFRKFIAFKILPPINMVLIGIVWVHHRIGVPGEPSINHRLCGYLVWTLLIRYRNHPPYFTMRRISEPSRVLVCECVWNCQRHRGYSLTLCRPSHLQCTPIVRSGKKAAER